MRNTIITTEERMTASLERIATALEHMVAEAKEASIELDEERVAALLKRQRDSYERNR